MNSEEQTLIDGLFSRLQQAATDSAPRDAEAQARIKDHMTRQPEAGYFMAQAILVQEVALQRLNTQNQQQAQQIQQLQDELQRSKASTPAASGGGFLSSLFGNGNGNGSRDAQAAPSAPSGGGWREPTRPGFNSQPAPPQSYPQGQPQAASRGGSFLGGALQTAAGVAGGVMLAQGISSLFNHQQQPPVVEEIVREEPAPASDSGGWGDDQPRVADTGNYANDTDSFADSGYGDDSSLFGDDDSFV